eukprot:13128708-Alexandrium_andersonii.AAC.1
MDCWPAMPWALYMWPAVLAANIEEVPVFNWNVRWLVNPSAAGDNTSRSVISRQLERGRPCLLQETRWGKAVAAIWK